MSPTSSFAHDPAINCFGLPLEELGTEPMRTGMRLTDVLEFFAS